MLNQPDQSRAADPKWWIAARQGRAALRLVLAIAASAIVLSGCAVGPNGLILSQDQVEDRVPFYQVPVAHAWISAPGAQLVLQRELGFGSEQRMSLHNRTLVPGENLIVLRTRSGVSSRAVLRFEEFARRIGDIPSPFDDITPGELISAEDELGSYFWTEKRFGVDTVCAFGIRRIDSSMRQIPRKDVFMDVMLRNCVVGTAQEALQPLLAENVGAPALARSGASQSRLISPLSGPTLP